MENAEEGELCRTTRGVFPSSHHRFLILHLSFSLPSSCSSELVYIQVFLSLVACVVASQRELDVTIQSTCFTFKSSCRAAISNHARGTPCVYVHHDYSRSTAQPFQDAGQCSFRYSGNPVCSLQGEWSAEWFRRTKWILHTPWPFFLSPL